MKVIFKNKNMSKTQYTKNKRSFPLIFCLELNESKSI